MVFKFRSYSYYHNDRALGDFRTGYVVANSIDDAIDLLYRSMWFDDSVVGHCVKETAHSMRGKQIIVTGTFDNYADEGIKNPAWTYLDPREWTKEGFSFGTPRIRMG